LSKPSDFTPDRVLEVQQPAARSQANVNREVWIFRGIGVLLLVAGWLVVTTSGGYGGAHFLVDTVVLALLGIYAFTAAARTRRQAIATEKRLRLGLLVHNMELENMAMQDDLTQLFNRRYFFDRLERELETAHAFKRPLAIILADLDAMKEVNDTYGHRIGDELLQNFGRFLLDQTRGSDVPARIGGDEFAIILPDTPLSEATKLMHRLAKKLAATEIIDRNDLTLRVEASLGCAGYPDTAETVDEIVQQADAAMYTVKHERKLNGAAAGATTKTPVPQAFRSLESETS
jgi:diguanylate cyclase (GGDEF)-like protein